LPLYLIFVFFFVPFKKITCTIVIYFATFFASRLFTQLTRRAKSNRKNTD
jgi:hypothetical protein